MGSIEWTNEMDQAFNKVKQIAAKDTLLAFPNFSKPFLIYTDIINYQMVTIITQDKEVIAYWSKKLSNT